MKGQRVVRTTLTVLALLVIAATVGSIETMPDHLPVLLAAAALAFAYLWRTQTVRGRRRG